MIRDNTVLQQKNQRLYNCVGQTECRFENMDNSYNRNDKPMTYKLENTNTGG
jgi:hypothetical protein